MAGKFYETHKDLYDSMKIDETGNKYTRMSPGGTIVEEQWTKIDGEWVDTTAEAQAAIDAEIEAKKAKRKAAKEVQQIVTAGTAQLPPEVTEQYQNIIDSFVKGGK